MIEDEILVEEENIEDEVLVEEETVVVNQGGTTDHSKLRHLDYESSGHTGFASSDDLSDEATARQNDVSNLQGQIDAITVSSDVVDIVGTYQELQNYDTTKLTDDDIIKVMQDSTHSNAMSYYRWSSNAWVYVGSEGPFYTKSESDTKYQDKLISGENVKTINNVPILGSGNLEIKGGYPEVPEKLYEYTNLLDLFNEPMYIPDGIYTVSQEWYCDIPKPNGEWTSDVINPNSVLYIYRPYGFISWTGPTPSMYWSNGDETFTGGVLPTIDDVNFAIDERLGSNVVMTNTEQTISGKKTFTSPNGTVFENAGGLILKYLSSAPDFKIIPDNNGNFDIYYQNTQLGRINSNYTTLYRGFIPSRNTTIDLGSSNYNWNKIYSKILASGSIEKNVVNLLTNDADIVPTYGNSFSIGSSSRLWNTLYALALHNGTTRIAISDIATKTELEGKQDTLTAGTGIAITNNVISSTLEGIDYEVDQELPATGEKGIIYLIPNGESETENIYDEYIWIPPLQEGDTGRFEFIGTTQTDLTNYVDLTSDQTISGEKTITNAVPLKFAGTDTGQIINQENQLRFKYGGSDKLKISTANITSSAHVIPNSGNTYDLGTSTYKWRNVYVGGNLSDGTNETTVAKINNNFAPTYDNTSTYAVGDKVIYQGKLYNCTTAIDTAEDFDSAKWTEISVSSEYVDISSDQTITGVKTFSARIMPSTNNTLDLGNSSKRWRHLYLGGSIIWGSSYIQQQGTSIVINPAGNSVVADTDNTKDLGASGRRWKDLYLAGNLSDGTNSVAVADIADKDYVDTAIGDIDTALQNLVSGGGVQ